MLRNPAGQPAPMNFDQMQNTAINVVDGVCSVISMPVDIILRPAYGTRYFSVPVVFCSAVLMLLLPAFTAVATGALQMIPFTHVPQPRGLFDIGSLARLYFLLSFVHNFRLYRRMIHMELEDHSQFEGPPLPFFYLLPKSRNFWFTRIVLEPVFVLLAATVLEDLFIIQSGLALYLRFVALALAMKNFIGWYRAWEFLRNLLDTRNAGPIIAKLVENKASEEDLAPIHLASFPKNIAPEIRRAAAAHIARVFSPGTDTTGEAHDTH
jgi:hypothetical protein